MVYAAIVLAEVEYWEHLSAFHTKKGKIGEMERGIAYCMLFLLFNTVDFQMPLRMCMSQEKSRG